MGMQPGALPFPRKELSPREALAVCTPPTPHSTHQPDWANGRALRAQERSRESQEVSHPLHPSFTRSLPCSGPQARPPCHQPASPLPTAVETSGENWPGVPVVQDQDQVQVLHLAQGQALSSPFQPASSSMCFPDLGSVKTVHPGRPRTEGDIDWFCSLSRNSGQQISTPGCRHGPPLHSPCHS